MRQQQIICTLFLVMSLGLTSEAGTASLSGSRNTGNTDSVQITENDQSSQSLTFSDLSDMTIAQSDVDALASIKHDLEFVALRHIFFDHDKAILDGASKQYLDSVAKYALDNQQIQKILIDGHANSIASEQYNISLSGKRASAVKDYLVSQGLPANQLQLTSYGKTFPTDENWNHLGQIRNRRVELFIIQHKAR
ncbi:MAG: OmpA family protein [Gammaproteobacteria bacterium]